MARASAASLGIVKPAFARPEPPDGLTEEESAVWRSVVDTKPAGWFTRDVDPLLKAYCRASVAADVLGKEIADFEPEWFAADDGLKRYERLSKMARDTALLLTALATKMRMAQQSRYTPQAAATAAKSAAAQTPWQREKKAG